MNSVIKVKFSEWLNNVQLSCDEWVVGIITYGLKDNNIIRIVNHFQAHESIQSSDKIKKIIRIYFMTNYHLQHIDFFYTRVDGQNRS